MREEKRKLREESEEKLRQFGAKSKGEDELDQK
jgi:hypothetical protein